MAETDATFWPRSEMIQSPGNYSLPYSREVSITTRFLLEWAPQHGIIFVSWMDTFLRVGGKHYRSETGIGFVEAEDLWIF